MCTLFSPQLVGRFALAVPHERDHGAAVPVTEETQHHVQRALRVHAEHFLHPEHVLIELHTAVQINGVELKNRIATETLDAIRRVVPKNFPVSVRINGAEGDFRPNGKEWDMNYMQGVAKLLVAHGADMVNVSMGGMDCMPNPDMRARYRDDIIQNIKNVVDVPVAAVNCLKTMEEGEEMQIEDLEIFENVAYIMAWHADPTIPGTIEEWLDEFEMFSIYQVLPEILELWGANLVTDIESEKNETPAPGR